ncbi:MAG: hypothetical protein FJ164_08370 [Gammaproteobacteria bacterium]|nr:hypothetical protein [Gammaproteobacteria bacterium]
MKIPTTCMPRAGLLLTLTLATAAVEAGTCNNGTLRGWYTADITETDSTDADGAIARMNFNGAGVLTVEATGIEDRLGPPIIVTVPGSGTYAVDSACRATFTFTYGQFGITETMTGTLYLHQLDMAHVNNLAYGGYGVALSNGYPGKFELRRVQGKF